MMNIKKGFTLAEILIVVVIIGMLASLVIPRFSGQQERGVVAEAVGMLSAIRQGEAGYYLEQATPAYKQLTAASTANDWGMIGIDNPNNSKFIYTVASDGTSTATRTASGGTDFNGKTIILGTDGTWTGTHPFKPN